MKKVGLLCGREYSFPPAFIVRVNELGKKDGVAAEFAKLGGTRMGESSGYSVIVDRISHEVEYYRGYLKHAVLQGAYVINNPFWWTADDKFFNYSVATKLGIAIPKTILLPQKGYPSDVDITSESLHNLSYPVDWDGLLDFVGRPAILKPFLSFAAVPRQPLRFSLAPCYIGLWSSCRLATRDLMRLAPAPARGWRRSLSPARPPGRTVPDPAGSPTAPCAVWRLCSSGSQLQVTMLSSR